MKKLWLVVGVILLSFNAGAEELVCPSDKAEAINQLEQALNNCKIDYGDSSLTSDMLSAYQTAQDCMKNVAYQLFDRYYTMSNQQAKESFDNYVKVVENLSYSITQRSDWAKKNHLAEVYALEVAGRNHYMIKNAINEYIKEMRDECDDEVNDYGK